jgi:hypothetical protein
MLSLWSVYYLHLYSEGTRLESSQCYPHYYRVLIFFPPSVRPSEYWVDILKQAMSTSSPLTYTAVTIITSEIKPNIFTLVRIHCGILYASSPSKWLRFSTFRMISVPHSILWIVLLSISVPFIIFPSPSFVFLSSSFPYGYSYALCLPLNIISVRSLASLFTSLYLSLPPVCFCLF